NAGATGWIEPGNRQDDRLMRLTSTGHVDNDPVLIQPVQPSFKFADERRLLSIAHRLDSFRAQMPALSPDPSRKFWIQPAVVFDDSPIRRNPSSTVCTIFFRRFGGELSSQFTHR